MPRNGSGTMNRVHDWSDDADNNIDIEPDRMDEDTDDIANEITNSLAKNGETTPTANLPMGGFKHTGVADGSARDQYAAIGQVQDNTAKWCGTAGGTANALTLTPTPAITAYRAGQTFDFKAGASANTNTTTVAISGLSTIAVQYNGAACAGGEIAANKFYRITLDTTSTAQLEALGDRIPVDASVTTTKIADGAVTHDKLHSSVRKRLASIQNFRLSLTSGVPVTTADVTGATTIYAVPKDGSGIALYDDNNGFWSLYTTSEFSLALGTLTSGKPYDVFCYANSGTPTLEFTAWTNDTTRATALAYQDGVLVKSGAATRRYLGTFYTTSTTTTEDSFAQRLLYNEHNQVRRILRGQISTASWTYNSTTIRASDANTTAGQGRVNLLLGTSQVIEAKFLNLIDNGASANGQTYIGLDSTTVNSGVFQDLGGASTRNTNTAIYQGAPSAGFHYLQTLENCTAANTVTFNGSSSYHLITASIMA